MLFGFTVTDLLWMMVIPGTLIALRRQDSDRILRLSAFGLWGIMGCSIGYEAWRLVVSPQSLDILDLVMFRAFLSTIQVFLALETLHPHPADEPVVVWKQIIYCILAAGAIVGMVFTFVMHV